MSRAAVERRRGFYRRTLRFSLGVASVLALTNGVGAVASWTWKVIIASAGAVAIRSASQADTSFAKGVAAGSVWQLLPFARTAYEAGAAVSGYWQSVNKGITAIGHYEARAARWIYHSQSLSGSAAQISPLWAGSSM